MARPRSRTRKIDNVRWDGFSLSQLAQSAGAVAQVFRTAATMPETLLRIRGSMLVQLDGSLAPGRGVIVTQGLILVPAGSATTVQFSPVSDDQAPWLWYSAQALYYDEPVTDVIGSQLGLGVREIMDGKAMRRVRPEVEIQWVVENTTIDGAQATNTVITGRVLFGS